MRHTKERKICITDVVRCLRNMLVKSLLFSSSMWEQLQSSNYYILEKNWFSVLVIWSAIGHFETFIPLFQLSRTRKEKSETKLHRSWAFSAKLKSAVKYRCCLRNEWLLCKIISRSLKYLCEIFFHLGKNLVIRLEILSSLHNLESAIQELITILFYLSYFFILLIIIS